MSRTPLTEEVLQTSWEAYEAARARGGIMDDAARDLGITRSALQQRLSRYRLKHGLPLPFRALPASVKVDRKLAEFQRAQDEKLGRILEELVELRKLILSMNKPQTGFVPSHRRISDGGLPVKKQRKAFKQRMTA